MSDDAKRNSHTRTGNDGTTIGVHAMVRYIYQWSGAWSQCDIFRSPPDQWLRGLDDKQTVAPSKGRQG